MIFLEIIIIGILFNFAVTFFLVLFTIGVMLLNLKNANYALEMLELTKEMNNIKEIRNELKSKGINTWTQESFTMFVPFSGLGKLFEVMYYGYNHSVNIFLMTKILIIKDKLEQRLANSV